MLLPTRRQNKKFKKTTADYVTCAICFGSYSQSSLRVHFKRCSDNQFKGERIARSLGRACEGRLHADACPELNEEIFARMRPTEFLRLIRFDWLVVCYGNILCLNFSPHYQHGHIRNKISSAGKLLLAAKSISSNVTDFASLYHVQMCDIVIEAIRSVAKFDMKAKQFQSPATASALVTLINTIGDWLVTESVRFDNAETERNAERFLKVFHRDAALKINKLVATQKSTARRHKKENIPTMDDIKTLAKYLDSEREKCFVDLSHKYSDDTWLELSKLTLVSIFLFNRRRPGEMMNMTLDDYNRREMIEAQTAAPTDTVPDEIKELVKSRIISRGKRDKKAAHVLMKHDFERCLDLLIHYREKACIPNGNHFVFALPSKAGRIRTVNACDTIFKYSTACEAGNPSSLRGTAFRKHMASYCSTLGLTDNQVTNLATYMGHDDKIHRDTYRHNPFDREVTQMTLLLEAAQGNSIITSTTEERSKHQTKGTESKRKPDSHSAREPTRSASKHKQMSNPEPHNEITNQHEPKKSASSRRQKPNPKPHEKITPDSRSFSDQNKPTKSASKRRATPSRSFSEENEPTLSASKRKKMSHPEPHN